MYLNELIVQFVTNSDKIWRKCHKHMAEHSYDTLIDIITVFFIFLCSYIFWEYITFYNRRYRNSKPTKCIDIDGDFIYNVEECPICLNGFTVPTRVACGHAYCLSCLVTYFNCNNLQWKCICPLCRSMVESNYNRNLVDEEEKKILESTLWRMIRQQKKDLILARPWKILTLKFVTITTTATILFLLYTIVIYGSLYGGSRNKRLDYSN